MNFADKLNFLFELSHAEGKELADEMSVTAPQISKMRTGVRGLPKNKESIWIIANFFARRCNSDFQKEALSQKIGLAQIKNVHKEKEMIDILLGWLTNERGQDSYAARHADAFLQRFNVANGATEGNLTDHNIQKSFDSDMGRFFTFYGNAGRRKAVLTFLQYITQRKTPHTISILTDEKTDWMMEEPGYSGQLQKCMVKLVEQGSVFRRIAGPILDMDHAFESLNRWFPLYMTGKATSYYYNRMRDNLNHLTLFVVPDVAVLFSFSVGSFPQKNGVTFFTTDTDTVTSLYMEYENYLSLCEPIMKTYGKENSRGEFRQCLLEFEEYKGNSIHRCNALSFITMPWDVITGLNAYGKQEEKDALLSGFAQRHKIFMQSLEKYSYTDIIKLAGIDEIMEERVPIAAASMLGIRKQYYTVKGYLDHLNSILFMLKQQKKYHAVIYKNDYLDPAIVYVKEGFRAILIHERDPFAIFEVSEHYLVDAFAESLYRLMPVGITEENNRKEVVNEIKVLIGQIEQRMMSEKKK